MGDAAVAPLDTVEPVDGLRCRGANFGTAADLAYANAVRDDLSHEPMVWASSSCGHEMIDRLTRTIWGIYGY